jgi:hypothetical protein
VEYRHGESENWAEDCTTFLKLEADDVGGKGMLSRIGGTCPMCEHPISKTIRPFEEDVIGLSADDRRERLKDGSKRYLVTCNCAFAHAGAPAGVRGCGAQGTVDVTPCEGGGGTLAYAETTGEQRDPDEWFEAAVNQRLSRVRELAGQWSTTLSAVTGLVAFGVIFDAGDADAGVTIGQWRLYLALAGLALAAALAAVLLGAQAAGTKRFDVLPSDLAGRQSCYAEARRQAQGRLKASQVCCGAAVAALGVALIVRFW